MALKKKRVKKELPVIGWREWVSIPDLGLDAVHAKIDTGATTSALHAEVEDIFLHEGVQRVRFSVMLGSRHHPQPVTAEADLVEYRRVKSSSGHYSRRPVIKTLVSLGETSWFIELTLANRETMGMPMLLGRQSLKRRFLVNPAQSYLLSPKSPQENPASSHPDFPH